MTRAELFRLLREDCIEKHVEICGFGPGRVFVEVHRNVVILRLDDCLSKIEKSLIALGGNDLVDQMRDISLEAFRQGCRVEAILGTRVIDVVTVVKHQDNQVFIFMVGEEDIRLTD